MKKKIAITIFTFVLVIITSVVVYTYPNGITGRTKKNKHIRMFLSYNEHCYQRNIFRT